MKRKMLIGIDLDSTLAKIDQPWLDRLNSFSHTNYRTEDWTDWNLGFLQPKVREVFLRLFTPDIYEGVKPYPGARKAVIALSNLPGVRLKCVTTNPSWAEEQFSEVKTKWLRRHIPELAAGVIFSKVKAGLGLKILVDDAPHHFDAPDYVPVLVERPWNHHMLCEYHFAKWSEGVGIIRRLVEKLALNAYAS